MTFLPHIFASIDTAWESKKSTELKVRIPCLVLVLASCDFVKSQNSLVYYFPVYKAETIYLFSYFTGLMAKQKKKIHLKAFENV